MRRLDVVSGMRPLGMAGHLGLLPGVEILIEIGQALGSLLLERLHLFGDGDGLVAGGQRAQFGDLAFEFGDGRFKIEKDLALTSVDRVLGQADNWPSASGKSTFLGKRVMGLDHLPQPLGLHMGVDLCRRNVRMAQHLLDRAQIRPAVQQVAGEAMAQHVRRKLCGIDPGLAAPAPSASGRSAAASGGLLARRRETAICPRRRPAVPGHRDSRPARRAALAETGTSRSRPPLPLTVRKSRSAARRADRQADQFRHAQSGSIEQLHQAEHAPAP